MSIKKITVILGVISKPKQEPLMLRVIEKLLKHFVRLWELTLTSNNLRPRDKVKILCYLILAFVLVYVSQAALFIYVLDKAR